MKAGKGDIIRALDVVFIGPLMMVGGYQLRDRPIGSVLFAAGALTIVFNLQNMLKP